MTANPKHELIQLLPIIEEDYAQVRDFFFGMYQKNLKAIIQQSGTTFLVPDEVEKMREEEKKGKPARFNYLFKTVSPRLEPLWFFVVSLCRALQEGEYPMNPQEAYWCGLADEVIGQNLPCMRQQIEKINASSNALPPHGAQSPPSAEPTVKQP